MRKEEIVRRGLKAALLAGAMLTVAGGAYAQTPGAASQQPTAARDAAVSQVEEVVVTAQKREENLQTVPVSVSAVTAAAIEKFHATDLQTLNAVVPNLQVKASPNGLLSARYTIRGLGTAETDPYAGAAVAIVNDGVVLGATSISLADTFDVERVEVLRGPQGTLFGASTTGGVINVITKQPTGHYGVDGVLTAGNYNRLNASAAVNFPIIEDRLAGKVSFSHLGRDGFYTDRTTGEKIDNINENFLRGYLLFTPSDTFKATLKGEYDKIRDGQAPVVNLSGPGELNYIPGLVTGIDFKSNATGPNLNNADQYAGTLTADWKSPIGAITSITGYLKFKFHRFQDYDGTPVFFLHGPRDIDHWQWSEEIRDTIHPASNIETMFGLYFVTQNYKLLQVSMLQGVVPGLRQESTQDFDNRVAAAFTQTYWDVTDRLRVQAGLRYTWEETKAVDKVWNYLDPSHIAQLTGGTLISSFGANGSKSWGQVGGKVGVDYKLTDNILTYAYYAHGFKSGGFNGRISQPADIGPYGPEKLDTVEAGFKSDLWDRHLRLNLAAFYNKYKDMQVPQVRFVGASATSTIMNAASAKTYGVEIESTLVPFAGFQLTGSLAYLEAQYEKFHVGTTCPAGGIPTPPPAGCNVYDDTQMPHAPKWTASVNASYAWQAGPGEALAAVQYNYTARSWAAYTHYPVENLKEEGLVNANVGWTPDGGQWTLSLWARNLLDKKYIVVARKVAPLFSDGQYGAPREFGVDFSFHF